MLEPTLCLSNSLNYSKSLDFISMKTENLFEEPAAFLGFAGTASSLGASFLLISKRVKIFEEASGGTRTEFGEHVTRLGFQFFLFF